MVTNATQFIKSNIGTIGAGVGGAALGGVVGTIAGYKYANRKKRKKRYKSKVSRKRGYTSKRKRKGGRYTPHTAGKKKDTSHKRVRYTKNGQPYIILGNGRARFIKMSSAKRSHKLKGGKY